MKKKKTVSIFLGTLFLIVVAFAVFRTPVDCLIEDYGSVRSSEMNFTVTLSESAPGITVFRRLSGFDIGIIAYGTSGTISLESWENHPGFFAMIDDSGRCWAYNGKDKTWIYETLPDGSGRAWNASTWPHSFPEEFSRRVPARLLTFYQVEQDGVGNG